MVPVFLLLFGVVVVVILAKVMTPESENLDLCHVKTIISSISRGILNFVKPPGG